MITGSSGNVQTPDRAERIRVVISDLARRRMAGEAIGEAAVLGDHPDLLPELAEELNKLRCIHGALDDAEDARLQHALDRLQVDWEHDAELGEPNDDSTDLAGGEATAAEAAGATPAAIGRYQVRQILGEGAFGRVYLAWDETLARDVAIKVPHRHQVAAATDVATYLAEARIVAALDHPAIVPVYDVGCTTDGQCYVVSKWIRGSDLRSRLRQTRLDHHSASRLVLAVAEALQHAHARGLVHRDIKPANILLDDAGRSYVADFGLALQEEHAHPGRSYAGTPAYMSPEQARGEAHRVDGRSDLFSLGVVFYELLTGRRPFRAAAQDELLRQILWAEPRSPREVNPTVPEELERICLKLLAKRAADRYPTAQALADDLHHFLNLADSPRASPVTVSAADTGGVPAGREHLGSRLVPKGLRPFDASDAGAFLALVPGPRDREGLPECLGQWIRHIEPSAGEEPFSVGVLYGPSGCGKSSLVRAGLLPRLSARIQVLYLECAADDTESRLLRKLLRRFPDLMPQGGLAECLATLRSGQGLAAGDKVLLVLDQFEQWLHGRAEPDRRTLVQALRQCDGQRLQGLVLVRDDFWLALSRFLGELEIDLVQRHNTALVDLFDLMHARRVLAEFGRAFGQLPENGQLSPGQEAFLQQALAGLADGDRVVPVRLALFAEMLKGKPWTLTTLRDLGGAAGVGVTFLEETFTARTANPQARAHQRAARAVLEALLPEAGNDLKGRVRPYPELLDLSGYARNPRAFKELMRILDSETRLLTPTDPEVTDAAAPVARPGQRYYQLTHDYLVPALRQWLTKKQQSTRSGRTELCLAERAANWSARPQRRQLPSLWEWFSICLFTRPAQWTPPQRKMMHAATRQYIWLAGAGVALVLFFLSAGLEVTGLTRDLLMRLRARSAAVWLALGRERAVWPLLQQTSDPTLRTRVIHGLSPLVVDAEHLVTRLPQQQDPSVQRALLLAAGELLAEPERDLSLRTELRRSSPPEPFVQGLLRRYEDDPDPGLHAAAEWLLRRYLQESQLARLDRDLASTTVRGDRQWYVNRQGHTLVVVPGPAQFRMGSPLGASMADDDETPHPRWIRSFCIASKETTVEQFQRFLSEHPPVARGAGAATDGPPDHPQGSVTWYEAAAYCNWLSSQEGLPPDQCCYAPNAGGAYASGMRVAPGYLQRRGYRLPTEAEWEYACRAGAVTGWHFGDDATYLEKYGVSAATRNEPLPIGRRKPNDFGLFDLLGNVAEWCQDAYAAYPVSVADASQTTTDQSDEVDDGRARVIRGGAFRDPADRVRCAARAKQPPTHRTDSVGFRVGRSYP